MHPVMTSAIIAGCAVLLGWSTWFAVKDRAVILKQLWVAAAVEAMVLVQAVSMIVAAVGGHALADPGTTWGYVLTSIVLVPAAAAWAFAERTRWSSIVMIIATLALAIVQVRMVQVWIELVAVTASQGVF